MLKNVTIHWFRRDLRLQNNTALFHALQSNENVLPLFIFDKVILDDLDEKHDARVQFIHVSIEHIQKELKALGSDILVKYGDPMVVWKSILQEYDVHAVYTNHDYEPYARKRDSEIKEILNTSNIPFYTYKDQVIFEKSEIVKDDGSPYLVFTPYSRKWKLKLKEVDYKDYSINPYLDHFYKIILSEKISLDKIGFEKTKINFPKLKIDLLQIKNYEHRRDYPELDSTSKLSIHLRFGTISIRELVRKVLDVNEKFLNELIWREFYQMILWHFPNVVSYSFKKEYDQIQWRNNEKEFELWCMGKTGYPIVDAGMRELNETGFMHNRVRMITASFLSKHLLIDWRWGEAYFAKKLLDYELASNNGGWQWATGTGVDAAPYFRIFNPYEQTKKFDKEFKYIKKWIPNFDESTYLLPIVEHNFARQRCLAIFKKSIQLSKE